MREPVGSGLSRIERMAEWAACGRRGTLAWRPVNGRGPCAEAYWRPDFPGKARGPSIWAQQKAGYAHAVWWAGWVRTGGLKFLSASPARSYFFRCQPLFVKRLSEIDGGLLAGVHRLVGADNRDVHADLNHGTVKLD